MARVGERHRQRDSAPPRPVGQSLWLLATVALAAVILSAMGDSLTAAEGASRAGTFSGQDLLELADGSSGLVEAKRSAVTVPAAPTVADRATDQPGQPGGGDTRSTGPWPTGPSPTGPVRRGEAALATISYPWRELLPGWTITFLPERDGLYGLTLVPEQRIEIYVRDDQSMILLSHVIAHELGHAVDVTFNSGPDRRLWEASRGIESHPWWPGSGATDFSTGAGDFAESFAAWQTGGESFRSRLADTPSPDQVGLLARLSAG